VSPAATTTYTLTATNAAGSVTRTVPVTVSAGKPPTISAFTAAPASITSVQPSALAWTVTNATSLTIDQGVGDVTSQTSIPVSPNATTIYTLTAANSAGSVTRTLTVTVNSSGQTAAKGDIFEQNFTWTSGGYSNPWEQVQVTMTLNAPSGRQITIGGFFYDTNLWKTRFAPDETGNWTWTSTITDGSLSSPSNGALIVVSSAWPGVVRQNPSNPFRWTFANGSPYYPIGIGDCIPGTPTSIEGGWGMNATSGYTSSLDAYLSGYGGAGFNIFRVSIDNCAPKLWNTIDPTGNIYLVTEGQAIDRLVLKLRQNGFRAYFDFFGFSPVFPNSPTQAQLDSIKRYAKYVVDRYGAYADFWELMNEASVDPIWYTQTAAAIRQYDPYGHPISTSSELPTLNPSINITSPHWYESAPEQQADINTTSRMI
jgi:hypothetical protein